MLPPERRNRSNADEPFLRERNPIDVSSRAPLRVRVEGWADRRVYRLENCEIALIALEKFGSTQTSRSRTGKAAPRGKWQHVRIQIPARGTLQIEEQPAGTPIARTQGVAQLDRLTSIEGKGDHGIGMLRVRTVGVRYHPAAIRGTDFKSKIGSATTLFRAVPSCFIR